MVASAVELVQLREPQPFPPMCLLSACIRSELKVDELQSAPKVE